MSDPQQAADSKTHEGRKEVRAEVLRTGLLLLGSAVFGGVAVALWNRRTLAKMQEQPADTQPSPLPVDDDAIY